MKTSWFLDNPKVNSSIYGEKGTVPNDGNAFSFALHVLDERATAGELLLARGPRVRSDYGSIDSRGGLKGEEAGFGHRSDARQGSDSSAASRRFSLEVERASPVPEAFLSTSPTLSDRAIREFDERSPFLVHEGDEALGGEQARLETSLSAESPSLEPHPGLLRLDRDEIQATGFQHGDDSGARSAPDAATVDLLTEDEQHVLKLRRQREEARLRTHWADALASFSASVKD